MSKDCPGTDTTVSYNYKCVGPLLVDLGPILVLNRIAQGVVVGQLATPVSKLGSCNSPNISPRARCDPGAFVDTLDCLDGAVTKGIEGKILT